MKTINKHSGALFVPPSSFKEGINKTQEKVAFNYQNSSSFFYLIFKFSYIGNIEVVKLPYKNKTVPPVAEKDHLENKQTVLASLRRTKKLIHTLANNNDFRDGYFFTQTFSNETFRNYWGETKKEVRDLINRDKKEGKKDFSIRELKFYFRNVLTTYERVLKAVSVFFHKQVMRKKVFGFFVYEKGKKTGRLHLHGVVSKGLSLRRSRCTRTNRKLYKFVSKGKTIIKSLTNRQVHQLGAVPLYENKRLLDFGFNHFDKVQNIQAVKSYVSKYLTKNLSVQYHKHRYRAFGSLNRDYKLKKEFCFSTTFLASFFHTFILTYDRLKKGGYSLYYTPCDFNKSDVFSFPKISVGSSPDGFKGSLGYSLFQEKIEIPISKDSFSFFVSSLSSSYDFLHWLTSFERYFKERGNKFSHLYFTFNLDLFYKLFHHQLKYNKALMFPCFSASSESNFLKFTDKGFSLYSSLLSRLKKDVRLSSLDLLFDKFFNSYKDFLHLHNRDNDTELKTYDEKSFNLYFKRFSKNKNILIDQSRKIKHNNLYCFDTALDLDLRLFTEKLALIS